MERGIKKDNEVYIMILKDVEPLETLSFNGKSKDFVLGVAYALEMLDALPEIKESIEVNNLEDFYLRVGEWRILENCSNEGIYCSLCHKKVYKLDYANQKIRSKFCPNCGAKMNV